MGGSIVKAAARNAIRFVWVACLLTLLWGCGAGAGPKPPDSGPADMNGTAETYACSDPLAGDEAEDLPGGRSASGAEGSLRPLLNLEPGPEVRYNGTSWTVCSLLDGVPVVPADRLAALSGGSAGESAASDDTPVLTLEAWDQILCFRDGSREIAFGGPEAELPVPARKEGDTWYLPLGAVGEALGCHLVPDADGVCLDLLRAEPGGPIWFNGTGLEASVRFGDTLCANLHELAKALGGKAGILDGAAVLRTAEHSLCFRAGSAGMEADGETKTLPFPMVLFEGKWFVPVRSVAEALDIPERDDGDGTVFSRVEPSETVLWINGRETPAFGLPDGPNYVRLQDVAEAAGGSFLPEGNAASLAVWGQTVTLRGGSASVRIGEENLSLDAPVLADGQDWYAPAERLLGALGLSELCDPDLDQIYYSRIVRHDEIPEGYQVPVLMYHAVSDFMWGIPELFVSPSTLEEQLQALVENGYTAITFEDLDRIDEIEKPVLLTFDDGYDDNYTELFPLLKKYNVKATVFVIVDDIGGYHKLTREQIREMSDSGLVSIQSHTMSHGYLDEMSWDRLYRELGNPLLELARITGRQPFVLCYPSGRVNGAAVYVASEYYEYGLCMSGFCYVTGSYPYLICRYYVSRWTTLASFLEFLG